MRLYIILLFIFLSSCSRSYHLTKNYDDGVYDSDYTTHDVVNDDVVNDGGYDDVDDVKTEHNWDWRLNQWRFRTYDYNSFVFNINSGPNWNNTYYYNPYWNNPYWNNPYWNNPYLNNPYWNNPYCNNHYWNNPYTYNQNPYNSHYIQRNIFYGHRKSFNKNLKSDKISYEKIPQKDVQQINPIEVQRDRTIVPYKRSDIQNTQQNNYQRNIENRGQNNLPNRNIQTPNRNVPSYQSPVRSVQPSPNRNVSPSYQSPVRSVQPSPNRNVSPSYQSPRNVNVPPRYNAPSRSNQVSPMPQRTNQLPSKNSIPQRSSPSYPRKN
jgi:hypothetical protein